MRAGELPREPTEAEWSEAERRRSLRSIDVYGAYEIREGLLRPTGDGYDTIARQYFPMATPGVLSEFARLTVGDEVGLVAFANRWGVLDYDALPDEQPAYKGWTGGDPVAWIWAHLAGIQVALKVHQLWRRQDMDGIAQFLAGRRVPRQPWVRGPHPQELIKQRKFVEAQAAVTEYAALPSPDDDTKGGTFVMRGESSRIALTLYESSMSPERAAWTILRGIINPNLRGVHAEITVWAEKHPENGLVVQAFDGLVSVIYRHLFEIIVDGNVQDCRECGTPFKQTDGRQRFCPPPHWTRESPCAMRYHKRRQRRQAREERTKADEQ